MDCLSVSEQFLNSTSAHCMLCSAIRLESSDEIFSAKASFPRHPGSAGTRKVKSILDFNEAKK